MLNKKYHIIAFGCLFNAADAEKVTAVLENIGYQKALDESEADLVLVLACSVRKSAIDRIYGLWQKFEKIKRNKPLITVLSGCVLKSDLPKMRNFFDIIFDIKDLASLPKRLKAKSYKPACRQAGLQADNYFTIHPAYQSKFQAYVPIMTGCNNFCSYCVVPYVRGREVSRPAAEVIKECQDLISQGYKLITLIGQNVNSYNSEIPSTPFGTGRKQRFPRRRSGQAENRDFPALLKTIDAMPGDYWLSFVTSHPKDMSDELIKVMGQGKHIIPYLHLPVQAGDNEILKKMNRHYTVAHYKNLIRKVRKAVPGIAISTDVIVGFPSESRAQFNSTVKLFKEVKFDMAYLAQYSPRAGTAAAKLDDDVLKKEKERREKILNEALKKTALENNKKLVGRIAPVLVDGYKNGYCLGRTINFKNIKFASAVDRTGQIVLVKIIDCYAWGLSGEISKVIVVLGTTSAGKTKLAVKLAKKFNGEIVSADSRQVYCGMDIGTGKDLAEYGHAPYHLIDIADPKSQFTVATWQKMAYQAIDDILKRGKLPIVCGGTGLYISALVEGYSLQEARDQGSGIRGQLNKLSLKQLLSRLKRIDDTTYKIIDKNNRRRVQRALEIYYQTGLPKSQRPENQKPAYEFLQLGLNLPKPILHQHIDQRLRHRLGKEGMISEIKRLHRQGVSWKRLEEFGLEYRFISRYLKKEINYEEMFSSLSAAIKDFAKRQLTWFGRDKKIIWLKDFKQASNEVSQFLKK